MKRAFAEPGIARLFPVAFLAVLVSFVGGCGRGENKTPEAVIDTVPVTPEETPVARGDERQPSLADLQTPAINDDLVVDATATPTRVRRPVVDTNDPAFGQSAGNEGPLQVIDEKEFTEHYPDQSLKRRWMVRLYSNYREVNPPEGSWANHGPITEYYEGGENVYFQGQYQDNLVDGEWKYFYLDGQLAKVGSYVDGKLSGQWRYYRPDGSLEHVELYQAGKENGEWTYYRDDGKTVLQTKNYLNGELHGPWVRWHSPDQMEMQAEYRHNKLEGTHKAWYPNGQPSAVQNFKDGKLHGDVIRWDEKGTELGNFLYEEGRRIRRPT